MLKESLSFILEIDRLKSVSRQSKIAGGSRRENSAEHSWHLAMCALVLADSELDLSKVLKMLLIHDIVEIDAGDFPIHSKGRPDVDKQAAEIAAAERIYGLLPPFKAAELTDLWTEFENGASREARFARSMDRLQPLLLNIVNGGGTWSENGVDQSSVEERYGSAISEGSQALWEEVRGLVEAHFLKHRENPSDATQKRQPNLP